MSALGGSEDTVYVEKSQQIVRLAGLSMPFAVAAFGLLTRYGLLENSRYSSDVLFVVLMVAFILLGVWNYYKARSWAEVRLAAIGYHFLAIIFLLFVTGINSPAIVSWVVLLVGTDLYFGRKAYFLSILALVAAFGLSLLIYDTLTPGELAESLMLIAIIAGSGLFVSLLHGVGDDERAAFERTRRKELLQQGRLTALINGMGDAVISTDAKGVVKIYNATALSLLDTNQALTGQPIDKLFHLIDSTLQPAKLGDILPTVKTHTVLDDFSHRYENGELVHLYISVTPLKQNYQQAGQPGYIIMLRDITKEKSLEEERDEFISVVSHELRTPIAITEGTISNVSLMYERGIEDKGRMRAAINEAHEQVMYLAKMINDLSTLSRAERGVADEPESIDVAELLQNLYSQYRPSAEAKGLALNLDAGPRLGVVMASRLYLEEVLQNFITNAIKYTGEGSVTIKARSSSNKVQFSVIDTGIGMSKSDQKHVYEKFYRSEDYRTRETSGTGLGLYVVRKLALKLGINISLSSRLNHGTTFSFEMTAAGNSDTVAP